MGKRNALNTMGELQLLPSYLQGVKNWEDNIKMNLREVGWSTWTGLIWFGCRAFVNAVINLRVP
jgi:hypothetical protein